MKLVKFIAYCLAFLLYTFYILPFFNNIVFDAIIHFSFAERFIQGLPFQYNLHETTLASTSPLWTMLLILFFRLAGIKFVILLKIFIALVFIFTTFFIYLTGKNVWKFKDLGLFFLVLVWLVTISVVKNAFGGMENILSAFQLILLYYLLSRGNFFNNLKNVLGYGLFIGLAILTRPEIGMLSLGLVVLCGVKVLWEKNIKIKQFTILNIIFLLTVILVLLPWYIYQYKMTGKIISDSSISRIYLGRWYSIIIFRKLFYLHPGVLFSIFLIGFLPFTAGLIYETFAFLKTARYLNYSFIKIFSKDFHKIILFIILVSGIIFYTFIVGGIQTGRYFLPFYPFLFIIGISSITKFFNFIKTKNLFLAKSLVVIVILYFLSINAYDFYLRIVKGKDMESNIDEMIHGPNSRVEFTTSFLKNFNYNPTDTIKLAITEVQFRYFVDDRIKMLSLDGRISTKVFDYADADGFPDFEKFITDEKADVVEVKGWYNFLHTNPVPLNIFKYGKKENVLSDWDNRINQMKPGDGFFWKGNYVQYIVPGYVKINWKN